MAHVAHRALDAAGLRRIAIVHREGDDVTRMGRHGARADASHERAQIDTDAVRAIDGHGGGHDAQRDRHGHIADLDHVARVGLGEELRDAEGEPEGG